MPKILLGCTPPGRYPRWGYLDRLETNEVLPRTWFACLALSMLVASLLHLLPSFQHRSPSNGTGPHEARAHVVAPLPKPLPPPSIQETPPLLKVEAAPAAAGNLIPAEDDLVSERQTWDGPVATYGGSSGGAAWSGMLLESTDWDSLAGPASLPHADLFVALEREPELVSMPDLFYPELARMAGIEGTVLVRALIGADGSVLEVLVLQSVLGLDEAALEAVAAATFRPARQQSRPVAAWVVVPIRFSLRPCP